MNNLSHLVTQFNCTQPLRPHQDGQVARDASTGLHRSGCDKFTELSSGEDKLHNHSQSDAISTNRNLPAASPAAGNASGDCICLTYIGDNGPCPVHGARGTK